MKALIFDGNDILYREDLPIPEREPHQSLIRILTAGICSTDREILKGYRKDFRGVMGHEFVGEVVKSGDRALIGKRVVGELDEGCGKCIYCRTGRSKHCLSAKTLGMTKDGCFAEYMTIATDLLHIVPDHLPSEKAVLTEPLAAALEITKQVHIDPSLNAAVIGDGRLAFMTAQVLSLTGIDLTVIGRHDDKLAAFARFARIKKESDYMDNSGQIRNVDPGDCFEIVADASGSESGLRLALAVVRRMGTIVLKSTYAGKISLNMSMLPVNEITIVGSRCGPFEPALKLLAEEKVHFPSLEMYPLEAYKEAFASHAFKAGFRLY